MSQQTRKSGNGNQRSKGICIHQFVDNPRFPIKNVEAGSFLSMPHVRLLYIFKEKLGPGRVCRSIQRDLAADQVRHMVARLKGTTKIRVFVSEGATRSGKFFKGCLVGVHLSATHRAYDILLGHIGSS